MTDYITSKKYSDAKTLFESITRTYTGDLPYPGLQNPRFCLTTEQQIVDLLDKRWYKISMYGDSWAAYFDPPNDNDRLLSYSGLYGNIYDYLAMYSEIPFIVQGSYGSDFWLNPESGHYDYLVDTHPSHDLPDPTTWRTYTRTGQHIGYGNSGTIFNQLGDSLTANSNYLWQESNGTPISWIDLAKLKVGDQSERVDHDYVYRYGPYDTMYIPVVEEAHNLWIDTDVYDFNGVFGGLVTIQNISDKGVTRPPAGIEFVWEDLLLTWESLSSGAVDAYEEDARFGLSQKSATQDRRYATLIAQLIESRMEAVEGYCDFDITAYSDAYAIYPYVPHSYTPTCMQYNGRSKGTFSAYYFYMTPDGDFSVTSRRVGLYILNYAEQNVHVFNAWYAVSLDPPIPEVGDYDPSDPPPNNDSTHGCLSISQTIATAKMWMFLGGVIFQMYEQIGSQFSPDRATPSHQYYSALIAYDEMQPYHKLIKEGYNYIPPANVQRLDISGAGTIFFDKDSNGNSIDSTIYICCRTEGTNEYFFGCTSNDTTITVNVKSPSNRVISVEATPYGKVTLA